MSGPPVNGIPQHGEEQYRLLLVNVTDFAIFMLDPNGRFASWNTGAERILGYSESEIIGQLFSCIFTPEDAADAQHEHELRTAREKGRSEDERWHLRKDGTRFWASGVLTALWDHDGKLRGFAKVLRDITERKRAEQQLAEANRRKDEFIAMLSHELRNPLAPILNALPVLQREGDDRPALTQAGAIIERQVHRLVRLVDDLLDVSRITGGKLQLHRERVEWRTVVGHAVETARPFIESRKHELTVSLPVESVWLDADPIRLEQVVVNLLNNAAKYTEPGGRIEASVVREGTEAVLRVKDNGIGMRPEMLPLIFDIFVQADRSLQRAQGGLGIGLTLVRRLVEMHGGTVAATSEGVGKGSELVVRLPTVPEVIGQHPEVVGEKPAGRSLRLLVVDDNVDTAESMAMLLRLFGHAVYLAHTGPKALQAASEHRPEVVLLDIGLPGMDGFQVAQHLREQEGLEGVRLLAITGYGQEADRQRSEEAGFDQHMVKPVDPVRLQALLVEWSHERGGTS